MVRYKVECRVGERIDSGSGVTYRGAIRRNRQPSDRPLTEIRRAIRRLGLAVEATKSFHAELSFHL